MNFSYNNASLGGALAVDNTRVEDDLPLILNYNCFLQYNIGKEDEQCPSQWKVTALLVVINAIVYLVLCLDNYII